MKRTIFITGASAGLGKATARLFHAAGWQVIATMRNPDNETDLVELSNIILLKLDVTNKQEIDNTIHQVVQQYQVDVVVNNAGYGLIGVLEAFTDEQILRQLHTNLLGTIRVSRAFTPYFREKKAGLFINISSMLGLVGYPTCSVYAATKFGMDGFSESLAYELAPFNIGVKIVAPGGIQTDFAGRSMDSAMHPAYRQLMDKVAEGFSEERIKQFSTAEQIAATIFEAATDQKDQLRYIAGEDAMALYGDRLKMGPESQYHAIRNLFDH